MQYTFGSGCYQPPQMPHIYIFPGFYCDTLGGHIIKPSFPLVFPATSDLIFPCSSACFVRCLLMPVCLWPILIHTVVEPMILLRHTHYNYTGTTPTSYHKVFEP